MKTYNYYRYLRIFCIALICSLLSGCVYWRLYQTKLQIDEFDKYFTFQTKDDLIWIFKKPIIYSSDFVYLSKLQPSSCAPNGEGKTCQYRFRKANKQNQLIFPEVQFFFELSFNKEDRLVSWLFSPLFLEIAPPELIELSLRSLGGAEIIASKNQVKADVSSLNKIPLVLPKKSAILKHMGDPLEIEKNDDVNIFVYHFLLETPQIEDGYQERALSVIKLSINNKTGDLVKMSGRFAGLKLSIDYRDYVEHREV